MAKVIYTQEFKTRLITQCLTDDNCTITSVARDNGVSRPTLKSWIEAAQKPGQIFDLASKRAIVKQWHNGRPANRVCAMHGIQQSQLSQWNKELGFPIWPQTV